MLRAVSSRLTAGFTLLLAFLSLLAFTLAYYSLQRNLLRQVDTELFEDGLEFEHVYQLQGGTALSNALQLEIQSENDKTVFYRLRIVGKPADDSDLTYWQGLPPLPAGDVTGSVRYATILLPGERDPVRLMTRQVSPDVLLQMGYRLQAEMQLLRRFRGDFGLVFALVVLCGALLSVVVTRRGLAGIEQVRLSAERISRGDLSTRIEPDGGGEEIRNLGESFNRMQGRIQALIGELGNVVNNVAHDLRSPLTRIRGLAETTLTGEQELDDYQELAAVVIEESDRLVGMINTMLEIAEADAGVVPLARDTVDLALLTEDVAELFSAVAEDREILLTVATEGLLTVVGDRARLQRALANLLDNALKYTPVGGRVHLSAQNVAGYIEVCVADSGPGIPAAQLPQVFDRFYRGDRSRTTPGSGLGLSLVQAIARVHGGEVTLQSEEGEGTRACLRLPAMGAALQPDHVS